MNAKVIAAINAMIGQHQHIQDVQKRNNEYFYQFKGYIWSLARNLEEYEDRRIEDYWLYYYPKRTSVAGAMAATPDEPMVSYWSGNFKGKEAAESFQELYSTLEGKVYGIDDVLDNIIDLPF